MSNSALPRASDETGGGARRQRETSAASPARARSSALSSAGRTSQPNCVLDAVGARARHRPPIVDAAGRTGRDAGHAEIADVRIDDVVARIMRDRADRAGRFAGVAADADFGVDQVLPDDRGLGRLHQPPAPKANSTEAAASGLPPPLWGRVGVGGRAELETEPKRSVGEAAPPRGPMREAPTASAWRDPPPCPAPTRGAGTRAGRRLRGSNEAIGYTRFQSKAAFSPLP